MSYDSWKLQTPEQYNGAIELRCKECDDDFSSYDHERIICQICEEGDSNG